MMPVHMDMIPKSADPQSISSRIISWRRTAVAAQSVAEKRSMSSPTTSDSLAKETPKTIEESLFDNAVDLKVALSQVTMHLSQAWRGAIFNQVDFLLSTDNWQDDSALINKETFMTFLRFIIFTKINKFPSIGVSASGQILAAWRNGTKKIALKFLADDKAVASVIMQGTRAIEIMTWDGHIADLAAFLSQIGVVDILNSD